MNQSNDYIKDNIDFVLKNVESAAIKSGRKREDIRVVAVSKYVDVERIEKALNNNIYYLGENRVQELVKKYDIINNKCKWDLIGHLQTNKVKYIIDKVNMIHSVDSIDLAKEIQKQCEKVNRSIEILIQVNVSGEESKFGISPQQLRGLLDEICQYKNLNVKGLMTIAPFTENPENARKVFEKLNKIFIDIKREYIDNINMEFLSMGMSNDYEVAIEEGASIVRIGTAIFGKR